MCPVDIAAITAKFGDQAYKILPFIWRADDHSPLEIIFSSTGESETLKFHNRFLRAFGDAYDEILETIKNVLNWFDALGAPVDILPYLSSNVGWPLDSTLPEDLQRQIVRHVFALVYLGKGNLSGIRMAILAFTGLECDVWAPNSDPRRLVLCLDVGVTAAALGAGSGQGALEVAQLQAAQAVVGAGDRVIVQHGEQIEVVEVGAASGATVPLLGGVSRSIPAGAVMLEAPGGYLAGPGWRPLGLGEARLAPNQAPYCIRLAHDSANNMLGGLAQLAWTEGGPACTDEERRLRFTFFIDVPALTTVIPAWKTEMIEFLANYMRPARTHYSIRYIDLAITERKFRLGISALDGGAHLEEA